MDDIRVKDLIEQLENQDPDERAIVVLQTDTGRRQLTIDRVSRKTIGRRPKVVIEAFGSTTIV